MDKKFENEMWEKCLKFATEKHKGAARLNGEPVINHPVRVAQLMEEEGYDSVYRVAALFHDLIEDTDVTAHEIRHFLLNECGCSVEFACDVTYAVIALTRLPDMPLEESIENAEKHPIASIIKGADRFDNAKSTSISTNAEDFISSFIAKTVVYYLPALRRSKNPFTDRLVSELNRLYYTEIGRKSRKWVDEMLSVAWDEICDSACGGDDIRIRSLCELQSGLDKIVTRLRLESKFRVCSSETLEEINVISDTIKAVGELKAILEKDSENRMSKD